jgi:hypothetical protein
MGMALGQGSENWTVNGATPSLMFSVNSQSGLGTVFGKREDDIQPEQKRRSARIVTRNNEVSADSLVKPLKIM